MKKLLFALLLPVWLNAQTESDQLLIRSVLINDQPCSFEHQTIQLNSNDQMIVLFSAISDTSIYYFQLKNYDTNPRNTDRPLVVYSKLGKGTYHFYASTLPDMLSQTAPLLTVTIRSSFVEQWGFMLLLASYLLLLIGTATYFIVLSNLRNKAKLLELRSEWANKLHNDIGGDLSAAAIRLGNLKKKLESVAPQTNNNVRKTYNILKDVEKKLRFVFDLVDPGKNSLHVVLADIEDFAQDNFKLKNIDLQYHNELDPGKAYHIDIGRLNKLYLVMKEAVNNCLKHSAANLASINIRSIKEELQIIIKDNGKGFDTTIVHSGNGLTNIQSYSREGLMDIDISSAPGEGTCVTILLPKI